MRNECLTDSWWLFTHQASLTSGEALLYNVGEIKNTSTFTAYVLPSSQQRPGPFSFGLSCDENGVNIYNRTLGSVAFSNYGAASSLGGFFLSFIRGLLF